MLGADNLNGFNPAMLVGITCSNLPETKFWKNLIEHIYLPAYNLPTYCVTIEHSIYNFNRTDPKLYKRGFLNFERFPCRKTCGFCEGKFLLSN